MHEIVYLQYDRDLQVLTKKMQRLHSYPIPVFFSLFTSSVDCFLESFSLTSSSDFLFVDSLLLSLSLIFEICKANNGDLGGPFSKGLF